MTTKTNKTPTTKQPAIGCYANSVLRDLADARAVAQMVFSSPDDGTVMFVYEQIQRQRRGG